MKKIALSLAIMAVSLSAQAQTFSVKSSDMSQSKPLQNQQVFNGFGCTGENQSPQLSWQGAPAETKSFAITAYDPDAPTGSGWWHWTVVNIPANVHELPTNAGQRTEAAPANNSTLPQGAIQGRNDFGYAGFGGACPPAGDKPHRYQFTVWALKTDKLPLDSEASGALVGFMLNSNVIAKAELVATYGR
ncbi:MULTISPECIES: kinase inhibitor [Yersinia]|uniref:kinase inhibitor n=1 Tax=Yersinia TaxID=629 RepID=UPI0005E2FEC9|nr:MULTISPECIES: kinase inhibitor [Yersinia]RXA97530.1 kinase inhibitor [Yersinia sp. 2105 StPb PI]CNI28535.1 putative kinase inhibitor [Yersinia frederiksenii]